MPWELIALLVGQIATAGAVYGAIRADLRNLRERADADRLAIVSAHSRIDRLLEKVRP